MSHLKLASLAVLALAMSSTAQAGAVKIVRPTTGIIINDWPDEIRGGHHKHAGLINVDWPDEVRGAHPTINVVHGRPQGIKNTPRPTVAPKGH